MSYCLVIRFYSTSISARMITKWVFFLFNKYLWTTAKAWLYSTNGYINVLYPFRFFSVIHYYIITCNCINFRQVNFFYYIFAMKQISECMVFSFWFFFVICTNFKVIINITIKSLFYQIFGLSLLLLGVFIDYEWTNS